MENLRRKMEDVFASYTGRWGLVVQNLVTGTRLEINPEMGFPAASMIKVPIMYEIMRQAAGEKLSLDETIVIGEKDKVAGAGILKELRSGLQMTVQELVVLMIVLSDNTATNLLIDRIGMETVNRTMSDLGLNTTVLRRRMMDFAAARAGQENETSAADLALLYKEIYAGDGLPETYGALMLDILMRQQIQDKLPFYLPEDTVIAHKTGTLSGVEHDAGIIYLPGGGPYIVCVLTADLAENYQGLQLVAEIGKVVYEHLCPAQTAGRK